MINSEKIKIIREHSGLSYENYELLLKDKISSLRSTIYCEFSLLDQTINSWLMIFMVSMWEYVVSPWKYM